MCGFINQEFQATLGTGNAREGFETGDNFKEHFAHVQVSLSFWFEEYFAWNGTVTMDSTWKCWNQNDQLMS